MIGPYEQFREWMTDTRCRRARHYQTTFRPSVVVRGVQMLIEVVCRLHLTFPESALRCGKFLPSLNESEKLRQLSARAIYRALLPRGQGMLMTTFVAPNVVMAKVYRQVMAIVWYFSKDQDLLAQCGFFDNFSDHKGSSRENFCVRTEQF